MPFRRVKDPERLQELIEAMLLIEQALEIQEVLRNFVDKAAELADARYGALGVLDADGTRVSELVTVGVGLDETQRTRMKATAEAMLGHLVENPGPLRVSDPGPIEEGDRDDPYRAAAQTFLGVPVHVRGDIFGVLYLCNKEGIGGHFTEVDEDLVAALALTAGLAIDKARLYSRMRELTLSEERERIARNLHDTVIQRLFAVGLSLQSATRLLGRPGAHERLQSSIDELDETIRQIRTTIFEISRPRAMASAGVRSDILGVTDEAAARLGLEVRVDFDGPIDSAVGVETAEHLLVTLREAISNVVHHAKASTVDVIVKVDGESLTLRVVDDGVGIDPAVAAAGGRGLSNLAERAKLLGGGCEVGPALGGGTELAWHVKVLH